MIKSTVVFRNANDSDSFVATALIQEKLGEENVEVKVVDFQFDMNFVFEQLIGRDVILLGTNISAPVLAGIIRIAHKTMLIGSSRSFFISARQILQALNSDIELIGHPGVSLSATVWEEYDLGSTTPLAISALNERFKHPSERSENAALSDFILSQDWERKSNYGAVLDFISTIEANTDFYRHALFAGKVARLSLKEVGHDYIQQHGVYINPLYMDVADVPTASVSPTICGFAAEALLEYYPNAPFVVVYANLPKYGVTVEYIQSEPTKAGSARMDLEVIFAGKPNVTVFSPWLAQIVYPLKQSFGL